MCSAGHRVADVEKLAQRELEFLGHRQRAHHDLQRMQIYQRPNNTLEPTAVGAFTLMITDNITSQTSAMPRSTAVAQLGR